MIIDPVTNGFIPNEVKSNFYSCDHSILAFGKRGLCLGFSNTSHVDILDMFRKSDIDKVKIDVFVVFFCHSKDNNMKIQYANEFVQNLGMGYPTTCVYQFIYKKN